MGKRTLNMRLTKEFRDRTKKYASAVVRFYSSLPHSRKEVDVLGYQLLRSGTSVAAHTREASRARSDAEFCSKIDGALQEADESELWLELLRDDCAVRGKQVEQLVLETSELIGIFVTMVERTKRNLK
jgi:four helix bundle protein